MCDCWIVGDWEVLGFVKPKPGMLSPPPVIMIIAVPRGIMGQSKQAPVFAPTHGARSSRGEARVLLDTVCILLYCNILVF